MREELAERVRQFRAKARPILSNGSVVLVLLMLTVGAVGAQTVVVYQGDFEDGTTEDWTGGTIVQEGGENMLWADADSSNRITIDGPPFNSTNFNMTGVVYAGVGNGAIEFWMGDEVSLTISWQNDVINLRIEDAIVGRIDPANLQANQRYNWTMKGNSTGVYATVEGHDTLSGAQPTYDGEPGMSDFGGLPGYLAEYTFAEGASTLPEGPAEDSELEIDTRDYLQPNTSAPYSVHFNDSGEWSEVTENATVTSNNTSVLAVNSVEHLLEGQPGVNTTVNVTANYTVSDGTVYQTTKQITVAQATVDNLEILPAIWRFGATFGDDTIFFLIIATLTSIVATRFSTAFGGLSLYWVVVMLGWFSGWVSLGILLLATVMCMFIGLNLAANINYTKGISTDTASITEGRTRIRKRK